MCEQMGLPSGAAERAEGRILPIYIGDDTTDEDAFELLRKNGYGIPIVVREKAPTRAETSAEFWLRQSEVADLLALFVHDRDFIGTVQQADEQLVAAGGGRAVPGGGGGGGRGLATGSAVAAAMSAAASAEALRAATARRGPRPSLHRRRP